MRDRMDAESTSASGVDLDSATEPYFPFITKSSWIIAWGNSQD